MFFVSKSRCASETFVSNHVRCVNTLQDPNVPRFLYHFHFSRICHLHQHLTPTKNTNERTRVIKLETSLAISTSAIASERLIHGLVTFSHIGNPWLSRLSRTRSTIGRPFIGDLCMHMNINIYFLNIIIFAFYAIVV